jgi:hypothetical protein
MRAYEYWNKLIGEEIYSTSEFASMNGWTVGMFNLAMKFAELYANEQSKQDACD